MKWNLFWAARLWILPIGTFLSLACESLYCAAKGTEFEVVGPTTMKLIIDTSSELHFSLKVL
jgi:hypothetical protein